MRFLRPGKHLLQFMKGVIFDCDGVMFDTKTLNTQYYNEVLKALGQSPLSAKEESQAFAWTGEELFRNLVPPERWEEAKKIRAQFSYKNLIPRMKQEEGLFSLLQFLHKRNVHCAVNTNRADTMDTVLEHFGLAPYFFPVMTAAKVTFPKPHPEGLHKILASWNMSPHEVMFIGDTLVDMEAARRAGVFFVAYKNTQLHADLHCQNFYTLQAMLTPHSPIRSNRRAHDYC